jgi:hypothetical protein
MSMLLRRANALNRSEPAFIQAQSLLKGEDSVVGRVIRRAKMNDLTPIKPQERTHSVGPGACWLGSGIVHAALRLASRSLLLVPNKQSPVLVVVIGLVLLLGCFWVLEKCFRLLTGRKHKGGLMTPNTLRVVSFVMLVLPIAGLFTGYSRKMVLWQYFKR